MASAYPSVGSPMTSPAVQENIPVNTTILHDAIGSLDERINLLSNRLDAVLRPSTPEPGEMIAKSANVIQSSPHGNAISEARERVAAVERRIVRLLDRIDL